MISFQNGVSNVDLLKAGAAQGECAARHRPVQRRRSRQWPLAQGRRRQSDGRGSCRSRATSPRGSATGPAGSTLSDDMVGVAWGKLLINLNNAVNALSGKTLLEELSDRNYRRVFAAAQIEALDILKAAGIEPAGGRTDPAPADAARDRRARFRLPPDGAEAPEDRRQCPLLHGRRFRGEADHRDRLSERRGGEARPQASASRRRSTRRSSSWSSRPRPESSGNGARATCAPMSSSAIRGRRSSAIEPCFANLEGRGGRFRAFDSRPLRAAPRPRGYL